MMQSTAEQQSIPSDAIGMAIFVCATALLLLTGCVSVSGVGETAGDLVQGGKELIAAIDAEAIREFFSSENDPSLSLEDAARDAFREVDQQELSKLERIKSG